MSEEKKEPKFVSGMFAKEPNEKVREFIKANISFRREEMIEWLQKETDEWVNVDVKVSKKGSWYCQVNDWKKPDNWENTRADVARKIGIEGYEEDEQEVKVEDIPL